MRKFMVVFAALLIAAGTASLAGQPHGTGAGVLTAEQAGGKANGGLNHVTTGNGNNITAGAGRKTANSAQN